jgi:hypothetical protein
MKAINEVLDDFVLKITSYDKYKDDPIYIDSTKYLNSNKTANSLINFLFRILYKIGVVGIKTDAHTPIRWSYLDEPTLHEGEVKPTSSIYIHPTFWRVLGINSKNVREQTDY